ncbi:nitrogen regulation protein NR(II) [Actinoplanes sp. NPDC049668]|uniref:two-component system sensor histidine kinase NtrB n=1 Tax=unclassified Actinoplanes TaxID=2626549 RepID=UPI0033AA50A3
MRYEDWRHDRGSPDPGWWRVGLLSSSALIVIVIGVLYVASPSGSTAFGLVVVVGPALAAASGRPLAVAAIGVLAMSVTWALGGVVDQESRLWVTGAVTAVSVAVAYGQRALERRSGRGAEEKSMLAGIVESSEDSITATDRDGIVVAWNRGAERVYGYTANEMIGQSIARLSPPEQEPHVLHIIARVLNGESVSHFRTRRRHKDGRLLDVSISVSPIRDRYGTIVGTAGISRDIGAVKRAEQQRRQILERSAHAERLESLGKLAGGIAHDFNNMLAINLSYLEFALERTTDPDTRSDLARARVSAERARDLTRQLLIFARKEPAAAQTIDLNTVVDDTRALLGRTLGTHIELITGLPGHAVPVRADRSRIEQVLCNLVINARDAMPGGGRIVIECGTTTLTDDPTRQPALPAGAYADLTVADNGTGMSPDVVARVFEPFFTTKTKHDGTGLGLATAYGIITAAGGVITVTSAPDVGTRFRILLPLTAEAGPEAVSPATAPPGRAAAAG